MKEVLIILGIAVIWVLLVHFSWYPCSKNLSITFGCRSISQFKQLIRDNKEIKAKIMTALFLIYGYNLYTIVTLCNIFKDYGLISKESLTLLVGYIALQAFNFFLQEKVSCTN